MFACHKFDANAFKRPKIFSYYFGKTLVLILLFYFLYAFITVYLINQVSFITIKNMPDKIDKQRNLSFGVRFALSIYGSLNSRGKFRS